MMVFEDFFNEPRARRPRPRFTAKEKAMLHQYQGGKCNGCKKPFKVDQLEVDHIRAFSRGGGDRGHNLQLLCRSCNRRKGSGSQAQLEARLKQPSPRQSRDPLADFFNFDV